MSDSGKVYGADPTCGFIGFSGAQIAEAFFPKETSGILDRGGTKLRTEVFTTTLDLIIFDLCGFFFFLYYQSRNGNAKAAGT
jgi:hypothetical protein